MTRVPWSQGKLLLWDVTVVNTVCQSYLDSTRSTPSATLDHAESDKRKKYGQLLEWFHFVPIGFETFGNWEESAIEIIEEIQKKVAECTGEARSWSFLRHKISIEIQRGNATLVLGTFERSRAVLYPSFEIVCVGLLSFEANRWCLKSKIKYSSFWRLTVHAECYNEQV